jgi:hypothetical protein
VARLGLFAGQIAVSLAQYWFVFGLWPKSWTAFALCSGAGIVMLILHLAVTAEDKC